MKYLIDSDIVVDWHFQRIPGISLYKAAAN